MNPFEHLPPRLLTRRQMLHQMGTGLGMLGLTSLLNEAGLLTSEAQAASLNPLAAKPPQFAPRAKRIIHIYLNGGPSHVDTFDPTCGRYLFHSFDACEYSQSRAVHAADELR